MRTTTRYFIPSIAAAGAAAAILLAPLASADPDDTSTLPSCIDVSGSEAAGTATTECSTPGNVQLNATPPVDPVYPYPWDDEFYGPALIIGGGGPFHGGGGHR